MVGMRLIIGIPTHLFLRKIQDIDANKINIYFRRNLTVSGTTTIPANSGITWEEALVDTVLRTAGQNSSALIPSMPTNLCRCHGGSTHCVGCDREPTMVKQTRARGLDGRDGPAGKPSTFQPREGAAGIPGLAYITVKYADGKTGTFHSKYKIELVDFQVVDENDDGIIEPGEHIFIQHIQIRNSGKLVLVGVSTIWLFQKLIGVLL